MRTSAMIAAVLLCCAAESYAAEPADSKKEARRERGRLVGTWECVSERPPAGIRIVKHFTPTHFTCVHYDRGTNVPKVTIGGTWTREGDDYKEKVEFASDGHKHLRGREFAFSLELTRGEFKLKAAKGSGIVVNETWKKVTTQEAPANAGTPTGAVLHADAIPEVSIAPIQADAIADARNVDRPLLDGADQIVIEESKVGGRRAAVQGREEIQRFLQSLKIDAVPPSAGEQVATISFFRQGRLLRKIWIYANGEWGFVRPGTGWTIGRAPELWRLAEDRL